MIDPSLILALTPAVVSAAIVMAAVGLIAPKKKKEDENG